MKLKDLIVEKKDDKIRVQCVGIFTYKTLKKNVEKKLKDLTRRNKQGAHYGVKENQFKRGGFCPKGAIKARLCYFL